MNEGLAMYRVATYRIVSCVATVLLTFGTVALSAPGDDRKACRDGSLSGNETIAACSRAISSNPKDAGVYNRRGEAYSRKGDYDRALSDFDQAIQLDPKFAAAYRNRGFAWRGKGDYDRAIADFAQAIHLEPNNAAAYRGRARAWRNKGRYGHALADYDEAIRLDPKNAAAYYGRGLAWRAKGDYDRAIADFDQAIHLDPKRAVAYHGRGVAYIAKDEYDRALADFDQAIRLDPGFASAFSQRGLAYARKGDFDRAMADLNKAITLNPKFARGYGNLAAADELRGDAGQAIAHADEAIRLDPQDAFAFNVRGNARLQQGEYAAAIQDFDEAIRLDPALAEARANRDRAQAALAAASNAAPPPAALPPPVAALSPDHPAPPPVVAGRRVALVIGNAQYRSIPALASPERDADAVANALREDGFQTVTVVHDLDRDAMRKALRAFRKIADGADWAVIYYAGHGIQLGNAGYLVPVDAALGDESGARDETVSYAEVEQAAGGARGLRLIIIDASRADPFAAPKSQPDAGGTLSGLGPPAAEGKSGTLIVYSTRDGHAAEQGGSATSPFARALVAQLKIPGREVRRMFDYVRDDVLAATARRQEPFVYGSLPGNKDFYFIAQK